MSMRLGSVILSFASGVTSHVLYFNRHECHMYGTLYLQVLLACWVGITILLSQLDSVWTAFTTSSIGITSFLTGAIASTLVYRTWLSPLCRFQGPFLARISSFTWSFQLANADQYLKLQALHQEYGPIVRIGSSDLSIIDPRVLKAAYSTDSKATRSSWYDIDQPMVSLHSLRSRSAHDQRRNKIWAPAFADKALREYEKVMKLYNDKLIQRIEESKGQAIDITNWVNIYTFDVMGRLAFGKDYAMLEAGRKHPTLDLLGDALMIVAFMLPVWFLRLLVQMPKLGDEHRKFDDFCCQELARRVQNPPEPDSGMPRDVMSFILDAYQGTAAPEKDHLLQGDAKLLIVAGSGSTASSLIYLFYELAMHPEHVNILRDELRAHVTGEWSDRDIRHLPHLNAVINETLRLHPAVPSGVSRLTPEEGMRVGETWIPGGVTFTVPPYIVQRDEASFSKGSEFIPERWYSKPELIKDKNAYFPFSLGPYNCIGKNLALAQMRTLLAKVVIHYDISFAPGEDGTLIRTKSRDQFVAIPAELRLSFTKT